MSFVFKVFICFLAGAGAGIGTGFAGMSAAGVIAPFLITFLHIPAYQAIGVGLASDVLASAVSAVVYRKHKHLAFRKAIPLLGCILLFTVIGSWAATIIPGFFIGNFACLIITIMGIRFIVHPILEARYSRGNEIKRIRDIKSIVGGCFIGFICGFIGAGGGMLMLFVLTTFLGYNLLDAVGTSVFIMAFTAFTGAVSHFTIGGMPDVWTVILCIGFTFMWARIASAIANKSEPKLLNRILGIILIVIGVTVFIFEHFL